MDTSDDDELAKETLKEELEGSEAILHTLNRNTAVLSQEDIDRIAETVAAKVASHYAHETDARARLFEIGREMLLHLSSHALYGLLVYAVLTMVHSAGPSDTEEESLAKAQRRRMKAKLTEGLSSKEESELVYSEAWIETSLRYWHRALQSRVRGNARFMPESLRKSSLPASAYADWVSDEFVQELAMSLAELQRSRL
jgi:hypothetical protein